MGIIVTDHPSVIMLQQLGGRRFIAMTGAKDFLSMDAPLPGLRFRLPSNMTKGRGTHFEIQLRPDDTYLLIFFKMRRGQRVFCAETRRDVYVEDLRRHFTEMTGLDTHL